jgi:Mn2+/Fe2+ NRAMP family transporter
MRVLLGGGDGAEGRSYWISLAVLFAGALVVIVFLRRSFTGLIDLATTLSFLTAPIIGYLNLRAVTSPLVRRGLQPPLWWRLLAWTGLLFLVGLGVVYLRWRLA